MKRYLILAIAALAFVMAAPSAFATRVVFDPPIGSSPIDCVSSDPCGVLVLDHPYVVDFLPCSDVHGVDTLGYSYCLWMVTGVPSAKFTFAFTVPGGGSASGTSLECASIPTDLATDDCPESLPDVGSLFTVSFFTHPELDSQTYFYLFTDFAKSPGKATVTASVPEPGALGMFGLGLLALGLGFGWQRRRRYAVGNRGA